MVRTSNSVAHGSMRRLAARPAAAAIGVVSVGEDAVRSGCHRPVFRPDAESDGRYLKVRVATP